MNLQVWYWHDYYDGICHIKPLSAKGKNWQKNIARSGVEYLVVLSEKVHRKSCVGQGCEKK